LGVSRVLSAYRLETCSTRSYQLLRRDDQGPARFPGCLYRLTRFTVATMDSPLDLIHQGFTEELWKQKIVEERPPELSNEELIELGRRAASYAVAPLLCSTDIGDRWDARRVTEFLDVSRQAVYKRVRTGSLLGLPGSGTTWFPVWQFDPDRRVVRRVVASIITQFRAADPDLDPLVIAAWVTAPHPQLDGASPADEIRRGGNDERVSLLAARAARGLAA
jgi:hypothetical protein